MSTEFQFCKVKKIPEMDGGDGCIAIYNLMSRTVDLQWSKWSIWFREFYNN